MRNSSSPWPLGRPRPAGKSAKCVVRLVLLDQRQQLALIRQQVDLVQHQHDRRAGFARPVRARAGLPRRRRASHRPGTAAGRALRAAAHGVHEALVERRIGLVNAGRVDEDDLRSGQRDHALDRRPGGLRLIGHDGHFLPHEGVQQRGFAGVGTPHQRYESGLEISFMGYRLRFTEPHLLHAAIRRWPALRCARRRGRPLRPACGTWPSHSLTRPPTVVDSMSSSRWKVSKRSATRSRFEAAGDDVAAVVRLR